MKNDNTISPMNKNIKPHNEMGNAHGYWEEYLGGDLWYKAFLVNGEYKGYEEFYYSTEIEIAFHI
jgi:hypothetical protein